MNEMQVILYVMFGVLAIKTIMGYHFPWETCQCCGKKYRDHTNQRNILTVLSVNQRAKAFDTMENWINLDPFERKLYRIKAVREMTNPTMSLKDAKEWVEIHFSY